jgi:hypothetical protein
MEEMQTEHHTLEREQPSRWRSLIFTTKAWGHRIGRTLREAGSAPSKLERRRIEGDGVLLAESVTPLYSTSTGAEFALQAGKVQNLRKCAAFLDGLVLPAGEVFSFWANVPQPTRFRGFAPGRELREGCVIPSIGGGLCQLTNSLYAAALEAGFEIVERHAHSRKFPGSMAERGLDATVFWNYVDLRFRAPMDVQIEVRVSRWKLSVAFRKLGVGAPVKMQRSQVEVPTPAGREAESCETCGVKSCFRNPTATSLPKKSGTAWLVDAFMPEHDDYMASHRAEGDVLLTPLDGRRRGIGPYRWDSTGFGEVRDFPLFTLRRSLMSRRLAQQGPARQRALFEMDEQLAALYEKRIPYTALHLVVSQNLLPHLWRAGVLGGRSFDVLMTRLPLSKIEAQLDRAAARWPEARMLSDFRADPELVGIEAEALAAAGRWITPHSAVAGLAPACTEAFPWRVPSATRRERGRRIVFPASTLARKGAYELREVARQTLAPIAYSGPLIEGREFWSGCNAVSAGADWLADAAVVVLPAWVENQPRRLIAAVAAGVPVIATPACGLEGMDGVTIIPEGDTGALAAAIQSCMEGGF